MALLTDDMIDKLEKLLIEEGLIESHVFEDVKKRAESESKPLFTLLSDEGILDSELLTHSIAQVSGVPYVNLTASFIDQNVLNLLPSDIAEAIHGCAAGWGSV